MTAAGERRAATVAEAAALLAAGGVAVFPTETVWGMGARWDRPQAVERIFVLKGRPRDKALQVLLPSLEAVEELAEPGPWVQRLARFMPGPLTVVLPARGGGTVGVRIPDHPVAAELCREAGPLAATSANRSGEPTPATLEEIRALFGSAVDAYVAGGPPPAGTPSSVVDCSGPRPVILREGAIPRAALEEALGW